MNPFDFLEYPEYFSIFMIWASGYVFTYCLFGKSREWKNFDATLKLLVSFIVGFAIEMCLILPLFYLNPSNLQIPPVMSAFDKTWIYHWTLTAVVSLFYRRIPNKTGVLNFVYFVLSKVMYFFFLGWALINGILLQEFNNLYPQVIQESTSINLYFAWNIIFGMFGFVFCQYFPDYIQDLSNEELLYGGSKGYVEAIRREFSPNLHKLLLFWTKMKNQIINFSKSKWRISLPIVLILFAISIIPLDVHYHMFTPNVEFYTDVENVIEPSYFLSIESSGRGYNLEPSVEVNFEKVTCDMVKINRGIVDQLGVLSIPLPSHCLRSDVVVKHYQSRDYSPNVLRVVYPESLEDNVTITPIPVDSSPDKLQVQFMTEDKPFNFTMSYIASTDVDDVYVYAEKVRGEVFNATHDRWIQEFRITNQNDFVIYLQDLSYDMLMFEDVDRDSITLQYNENVIDYVNLVSDLYRNLHLYVGNGQTVTIIISYLSTNKFP
jgi:hypothetical protein